MMFLLMIVEASRLLGATVRDVNGRKIGRVDRLVIDGVSGRIFGFQVIQTGLVSKFLALQFFDVISFDNQGLVIKDETALDRNLADFDRVAQLFGPLMGVKAKTESGRSLGRVSDLFIDSKSSGLIIRFVIRYLLKERIIPRRFVVSVSPREVVFQDIVDQPTFDQIATAETIVSI